MGLKGKGIERLRKLAGLALVAATVDEYDFDVGKESGYTLSTRGLAAAAEIVSELTATK
jgi:hypothetical protein